MMKTNTCSVLFATLLALAIPSHVEAHGYVKSLQIVGGESFTGPKPGSTGPNKSPIRGITDQSPLTDLQAKDIICGRGASAGSLVASAKPGDMLSISVSFRAVDLLGFLCSLLYPVGERTFRQWQLDS